MTDTYAYLPWPEVSTDFDRRYPEFGQGQTVRHIIVRGDVPARPFFRVFGNITAPTISGSYIDPITNTVEDWHIITRAPLVIDAGHWIDIDSAARTIKEDDGCTSLMARLDWRNTVWPAIPPGARISDTQLGSTLVLTGGSADDGARVEATWRNGWLS